MLPFVSYGTSALIAPFWLFKKELMFHVKRFYVFHMAHLGYQIAMFHMKHVFTIGNYRNIQRDTCNQRDFLLNSLDDTPQRTRSG